MTSNLYAEVVLPLPLDQPFTYAVPKLLCDRAVPGMRATVPFGKRIETGYIVRLSDTCEFESPRAIIDLPDESPIFTDDMLALCEWMADYYCCSWGEALQCGVPSGLKVRSKKQYSLLPERLNTGRFTDRQKKVIAELYKLSPRTEAQLANAVGTSALSSTLHSLVSRGIVLAKDVVQEDHISLRTDTYARLVEEAVPRGVELAAMQRRSPKQAAVYLDLLHGEAERRTSELRVKHLVNAAIFRSLENKGLITLEEREWLRTPDIDTYGSQDKLLLNQEQRTAFEHITGALNEHRFETVLLHGVTGSGKTEVYLQAIEHAMAQGKTAIILVPEISLTPQTVGRFKARFDTDIAVLHSGLSRGERYDEWRRAQRGDVRIVVGARSAVFAPLDNLGIIVVDEEHDTSYKQGETPRYHARDVAIMRAQRLKAVCVLGSATPSIESYYKSATNKFTRIDLLKRATRGRLPDVTLLDMREEARETKGELILSRRLEAALKRCYGNGEQAILLLNRRGFSPFVLCPKCGWVAECEDCQVTMTYHAKGAFLSCHYCNARRDVPATCSKCHFKPLRFLGTGTQKVEDYLGRAVPGARIARMDADTTAGKGGHAKILGQFAQGDIDILVGTQMIAKGHDYPGVTLVGVINADTGLSMPDFRAAETTFQLLTQVAGRAGRGDKPGEVIIQTYRPKHYAIQAAQQHDYGAFYQQEIEQRHAGAYPPFRRMANLMIESEDPLEAERAAVRLRTIVREGVEELGFKGVEILGPAPAAVRRVMKKYRWNLALLSRSGRRLNKLARRTRDQYQDQFSGKKVALKIDLDPYGMT